MLRFRSKLLIIHRALRGMKWKREASWPGGELRHHVGGGAQRKKRFLI